MPATVDAPPTAEDYAAAFGHLLINNDRLMRRLLAEARRQPSSASRDALVRVLDWQFS